MSAFDELTLAEVDEVSQQALGGKSFSDENTDALMMAAGIMWVTLKRQTPDLTWPVFKASTRMSDIKAFALEMEHEELANPI